MASFPPFAIVLIALLCSSPYSLWAWLALLTVIASWATSTPTPIPNGSKWRVAIVGAGASGLCMAKRLKDVGIHDFVILEKSHEVGGTWLHNRYPGVACDITSHFYCFSFHYNPNWSRAFSGGKEILEYFKNFAKTFDLYGHIRFGVHVDETRWDDQTRMWTLSAGNERFEANFFISATGPLIVPNVPPFKDMKQFKGTLLHSAEWDDDLELSGKRVGVIGTGATAVQIVPTIADEAKSVHLFQRTPAWSPYRRNFYFPALLKAALRLCPFLITAMRYFYFITGELAFHLFFTVNRWSHPVGNWIIARGMRRALNHDPDLCQRLIPEYSMGCKRVTPSQNYLRSFQKDNVHLLTDPIEGFTSNGVVTKSDVQYEFDVVILATGYDLLATCRPFQTFGENARQSQEDGWRDEPRAYLGVAQSGFPNKFMICGPGSGLGHSSILYVIECQVNYVIDCIRKLSATESKKSMNLKSHVYEDFIDYLKHSMRNRAFNGNCFSWYKNSRGVNWTLWPNDLVSFWYHTYSCSVDDYDFS